MKTSFFSNKIAKAAMFIIAGYLQLPILGFILFVTIGHIIDISLPHLKVYFDDKLSYQRSSSDCIFLLAYSSYVLGLDTKKSAKYVLSNCSSNCNDSVESLFTYYATNYMSKHGKDYVKIDKKLEDVKVVLSRGMDDAIGFFGLIEGMYDDQANNATAADIHLLKKIADIFDINYIRKPEYNNTQTEQETPKYNYNYQEENLNRENTYKESRYHGSTAGNSSDSSQRNYSSSSSTGSQNNTRQTSSSSYISQEVKDAFTVFNLKPSKDQSLVEVKRIYKQKVRKLHPDILKGQNASAKKLAQAEEKLVELNKSIDIVKKFLANS